MNFFGKIPQITQLTRCPTTRRHYSSRNRVGAERAPDGQQTPTNKRHRRTTLRDTRHSNASPGFGRRFAIGSARARLLPGPASVPPADRFGRSCPARRPPASAPICAATGQGARPTCCGACPASPRARMACIGQCMPLRAGRHNISAVLQCALGALPLPGICLQLPHKVLCVLTACCPQSRVLPGWEAARAAQPLRARRSSAAPRTPAMDFKACVLPVFAALAFLMLPLHCGVHA